MTIAEIIKRLDAGETGREIEELIAPLDGWGRLHAGSAVWRKWPMFGQVPAYTTSLDAALTLVPEGWSWRVETINVEGSVEHSASVNYGEWSVADTSAAALCIAALRARGVQP